MAPPDYIRPPDWATLLEEILERGPECFAWELPEGWFHAELYAKLKSFADSGNWNIFPSEIPYVTFCPVIKPRDERPVKWVDLCLQAKSLDAWSWFELKVRHIGAENNKEKASRQARDAFRKDVAGLVGFDCKETAKLWGESKPKSNFYSRHVGSKQAETLSRSSHHFAGAFVQLDGSLEPEVRWEKEALRKEIENTVASRAKHFGRQANLSDLKIDFHARACGKDKVHSLILCQWSKGP